MRDSFVIDPLIGKRQQLLLATQLCRMVLKVRQILPSLVLLLGTAGVVLLSKPMAKLPS